MAKLTPEQTAKRIVDRFIKSAKGDMEKAKFLFAISRLGRTDAVDERKAVDAEFMRRDGYTEKQIRGVVYGDWGQKK